MRPQSLWLKQTTSGEATVTCPMPERGPLTLPRLAMSLGDSSHPRVQLQEPKNSVRGVLRAECLCPPGISMWKPKPWCAGLGTLSGS